MCLRSPDPKPSVDWMGVNLSWAVKLWDWSCVASSNIFGKSWNGVCEIHPMPCRNPDQHQHFDCIRPVEIRSYIQILQLKLLISNENVRTRCLQTFGHIVHFVHAFVSSISCPERPDPALWLVTKPFVSWIRCVEIGKFLNRAGRWDPQAGVKSRLCKHTILTFTLGRGGWHI